MGNKTGSFSTFAAICIVCFMVGVCFECKARAASLQIEAKVGNGAWRAVESVEVLEGRSVSLRVKKTKGASIRWRRIDADLDTRYNNAVWPWLPGAYKWKGFDEIKYEVVDLPEFDDQWEIVLFEPQKGCSEKPSFFTGNRSVFSYMKTRIFGKGEGKSRFFNERFGSFRFQAVVEKKDGAVLKSPGVEDGDSRGLSPDVFRVSVKKGDDLIGNLTSFFNVPGVFGSTPYQVRSHIGVDCADVLMAAWCKTRRVLYNKDYNVAMLTRKFPVGARAEIAGGRPDKTIRWNRDVRPGDFIAVKYSGYRQFGHIGALYEDENGNGILDEPDTILHAGPDPLHESNLGAGKFDGAVVILRTR